MKTKIKIQPEHVHQRLLLTDAITGIPRHEWHLLEISPNGKTGKFKNEINGCLFWTDLEDWTVLDVLPTVPSPAA